MPGETPMRKADDAGFSIGRDDDGKMLVVTDIWTDRTRAAFVESEADGLLLNYARGFRERDLRLLEGLHIRRLQILARTHTDLTPLYSLAESLESLTIEVSDGATLDLGRLPLVKSLAAEWPGVRETFSAASSLCSVVLMNYDAPDFVELGSHERLRALTIKVAPRLQSVAGLELFKQLETFALFGAPQLRDVDALTAARGLKELQLEDCRLLSDLDFVRCLDGLEFLNVSDCGEIDSLTPLARLAMLRSLHAWGSTRIADGDLTVLLHLPKLRDLRMADRRHYRPQLREVQARRGFER